LINGGILRAGWAFSSLLTLVLLRRLRLKIELSDEISVLANGVLVDRALVKILLIDRCLFRRTRTLLFGRWAFSIELNVRERIEKIFTLGVFKVTLRLVPGSSFEVKSMDPDTFRWLGDALSFNASVVTDKSVSRICNFRARLDGIQSPVVSSVSTSDFLSNGSEESLTIEESSQPVRNRPVFLEPGC